MKYLKSKKTILYICAAIIAAVLGTGFSFIISHLVNLVQSGTNRELGLFIVIGCGYVILTILFEIVYTFTKYELIRDADVNLKSDLFAQMLNKGVGDFERQNSSFYLNELTSKADMFSEMYFKNILGLPYFAFSFVSAIVVCIYLNPFMLLIMLLFGAITVLITRKFSGKISATSEIFARKSPIYTQKLKDYLEGFRIIKIYGIEGKIGEEQKAYGYELEDAKCNNIKSMIVASTSGEFIGLISTVIITGIAALLALNGYVTIGAVFAFAQLMGKITSPISSFVDMAIQFKAITPIKQEFEKLLQEKNEEKKKEIEKLTSIRVEKLSFKYENMEEELLKDIDLVIDNDEKVLITGDSGSGKSTLISLLMGFLRPVAGTVFWGENNLAEIDSQSVFSRIGFLSQKAFVFEDSIKNNICLYRDYSEEKIKTALEKAGLTEFISSLPNGIETIITEDGKNISGGEKQRICLARMIIRDSDVIILDEFETGLDATTREAIEDVILSDDTKLVIAISHNTDEQHLRKYDKIYNINQNHVMLL